VREVVAVGLPRWWPARVSELVRVLVVSLVAIAGGAAGVAAYTVGARVATLAVVPALGMQQAAQSMIGQNLGADAPHRPADDDGRHQTGRRRRFLALGAVQFLFAGAIADLLAPDLTATGRSLSVLYLRILAVTYWALGGTYTPSPASTALRAPEPRSSRI